MDGNKIKNQEIFYCNRNNLKIQGKLYFPYDFKHEIKYPIVIISHGFTGDYLSVEDYSTAFTKMGYVACAFDFCGGGPIGISTNSLNKLSSDGETTDMTILTEVLDLLTVKNYVISQPYIDPDRLIFLGISQGGLVAGLTAARCKEEVKKLIMIYPALCIPDHARRGCLAGSSYDPQDVPERIDCISTILGKSFHDTVVGMDPYLELSKYKGPVLILHGVNDDVVNYSYSIRAKESYKTGQCHLQLIRETGHWFHSEIFDSAIGSIRQFLLDREEILTIRVIITHVDSIKEEGYLTNRIYFTGYCDTKHFQGTIIEEGCDTQKYHNGNVISVIADYTLKGIDSNGMLCTIHIINQKVNDEWIPIIDTDSIAMSKLNNRKLTAILENSASGPTVRIFCDK